MIRPCISLKPPATPTQIRSMFKKNKKNINFLLQSICELYSILDFLSLSEIFILYKIIKYSKSSKQIENKIIFYLMRSKRKYSDLEEEKFTRQITKNQRQNQKKYSRWSIEDNYWRQSINQDVDRTYIQTIVSSRQSQKLQAIQQKNQCFRISTQMTQKKSSQYSQSNNQNNRSFFGINSGFLLFSFGEPNSQKKNTLREVAYRQENIKMKVYMKNVLYAVVSKFKKMGYVQGFHYWIKHMYLSRLSEQYAINYSTYILEKMKGEMLFREEMVKVRELCYVFQIYLFNNLPSLYYLLKKNDISATLYASSWFITLFSQQLPKRIVNKLWHLFILKGWKMLIKFGIAVLCCYEPVIKSICRDQINEYLRNIMSNITYQKEEKIWAIMSSIKVSNKMIDYLSKQMKIISNDTEIELWRLDQERMESSNRNNNLYRRFSLSFACRPSVVQDRFEFSSFENNILQENNHSGLCCQKYQQPNNQGNLSLLSLCKSVEYHH